MGKMIAYRNDIGVLSMMLAGMKDNPFATEIMPDILNKVFYKDKSEIITIELEDFQLNQLDEAVDDLLETAKLTPNLRSGLGNIKNSIARAK